MRGLRRTPTVIPKTIRTPPGPAAISARSATNDDHFSREKRRLWPTGSKLADYHRRAASPESSGKLRAAGGGSRGFAAGGGGRIATAEGAPGLRSSARTVACVPRPSLLAKWFFCLYHGLARK